MSNIAPLTSHFSSAPRSYASSETDKGKMAGDSDDLGVTYDHLDAFERFLNLIRTVRSARISSVHNS